MKRGLMRYGMVGAMVIVGTPVFAQDAASKAKDATVVMTGCVAVGEKAGEYVLSNPKGADQAAAPSTTPSAPAGAVKGGKTMSYTLDGGDMKGHIGHTVAVTGTLEDFKPSNSAHQMPGATAAMAKETASSTLHVKSVKMVAPSCAESQ